MAPRLTVAIEHWPIAGGFTISRGTKTEAVVVVAEIRDGEAIGRGECVPYARYGETIEAVRDAIAGMAPAVAAGLGRTGLATALPPGAARNALDCALWDLEAKRSGCTVYDLAGLPPPSPLLTAYTLSLGTPEAMGEAARKAADRPLLKLKLGGDGDDERIAAVRENAPAARLIVDANEAWSASNIETLMTACAETGVELIEQPLPAEADGILGSIAHPVPICADESVHDRSSLSGLARRYDAINIKLDKTGGLTEALALAEDARRLGFGVMVGCMLATSLAMAPALVIARMADWVDLDGPLLLARDRRPGLSFEGSLIHPAQPALWG